MSRLNHDHHFMPMISGVNHSSPTELLGWNFSPKVSFCCIQTFVFVANFLINFFQILPSSPLHIICGLISGSYFSSDFKVTQRLHTKTILSGVFPPESPCLLIAGILRISSALLERMGSQGQGQPMSINPVTLPGSWRTSKKILI